MPTQSNTAFDGAEVVNAGTRQMVTLRGVPFGDGLFKLVYSRAVIGSPFSFGSTHDTHADELMSVSHAITIFREDDYSVLFSWSFVENDVTTRNRVEVFSNQPKDVKSDVEYMLMWKQSAFLAHTIRRIAETLLLVKLNLNIEKLVEEPVHVNVSVTCAQK